MTARVPDFAAWPRERIALKWHRRHLLTALTTELRVRNERSEGGADMKIPDLGLLPDEILELMTPQLTNHYVAEDFDATFEQTVARFDGRLTLGEIADHAAAECGWSRRHAFNYVRGVFLHLASSAACLPKR